jgi:hypothetical protein
MLQEIKTMFNQFDGVQKGIVIFWGICVVSFWYYYVRVVISIISNKFFNTQKL